MKPKRLAEHEGTLSTSGKESPGNWINKDKPHLLHFSQVDADDDDDDARLTSHAKSVELAAAT